VVENVLERLDGVVVVDKGSIDKHLGRAKVALKEAREGPLGRPKVRAVGCIAAQEEPEIACVEKE
jgi:hypothetical protein